MDVKIILEDKSLGMAKFDLKGKIHALREYGELVIKHYNLSIDNYTIDIYLNKSTKLDMEQIGRDLMIAPYRNLFTDPYIYIHASVQKTKFENLRKDEILYMGLFMDPQTILNLSKTNKRFNQIFNDNFWRLKTERDYPGFLKEKETWKDQFFYLYRLKDRIYQDVKPILKEIHPGYKISHQGIDLIATLLEPVIYPLMMIRGNNTEFDHKIMEQAIKNAIPGQLGKHAWAEYTSTRMGRSQRYEPNTIGRVIEYLMAEILEIAGNYARNWDQNIIKTLDIYVSIYRDKEIFDLLYDYLPAFPFDVEGFIHEPVVNREKFNKIFDEMNIEVTVEYKEMLYNLNILLGQYVLFRLGNMINTLKDIITKSRKIQPVGSLTSETLLETVSSDKHLATILNEYKQSRR